jgi:hypothetical protein
MVTGEGWGGDYAKGVVGAAFSVPCVKRPDLLPGLSLCTDGEAERGYHPDPCYSGKTIASPRLTERR